MNIVVLSGSPRKGGNTDLLVEAFVKGASEKHNVEVVLVRDHHINPCIGCDSCFKRENNSCFQNDNMQLIYDKLLACCCITCIFLWHQFAAKGCYRQMSQPYSRQVRHQTNGFDTCRCGYIARTL